MNDETFDEMFSVRGLFKLINKLTYSLEFVTFVSLLYSRTDLSVARRLLVGQLSADSLPTIGRPTVG